MVDAGAKKPVLVDAEQAVTSHIVRDESTVTPELVKATAAEANVLLYYRGNPDLIPVALKARTAQAGASVPVVVNNGRWIVECPSGDGGAQMASREDRRFMCLECLNAEVSGQWRPVVWPADVAGIEAVLSQRGQANRNWLPHETVADLQAENEAHK